MTVPWWQMATVVLATFEESSILSVCITTRYIAMLNARPSKLLHTIVGRTKSRIKCATFDLYSFTLTLRSDNRFFHFWNHQPSMVCEAWWVSLSKTPNCRSTNVRWLATTDSYPTLNVFGGGVQIEY